MKVLVVGSKSVHVSSYIQALNKQGVTPYLLTEEPCNFKKIEEEFIASYRSLNPSAILSANKKVREILSANRPDVVHLHQVNRLAYFVSRICAMMNIPCITTAWGSDVLVVPKKNAFFKFLVKKTLERSEIVTADSKEMIAAMNSLSPAEKYVHMQYGIDEIKAMPKEKIIYSNRLHESLYRIDKIIDYFEEIHKEHSEWRLIIGAVGSLTEDLKKQVKEKGLGEKVKFVGWLETEDNHYWYARASIYMSIPKSDGTAVSLLEAMSAGCIPIVPNLEVSHEWIEDGINGVIENEVQNPILQAMQLDQVFCAEKNKSLISGKASRESCTKAFIKFYKEIQ